VKKAWKTACDAAGLPGLHFHDLRRSAVRNMDRAGVPRPVAMRISGHKTESMYNRYNIVSERDLADVKEKMEQFLSDTLFDTPAQNSHGQKKGSRRKSKKQNDLSGAPGVTRTPGLLVRSQKKGCLAVSSGVSLRLVFSVGWGRFSRQWRHSRKALFNCATAATGAATARSAAVRSDAAHVAPCAPPGRIAPAPPTGQSRGAAHAF